MYLDGKPLTDIAFETRIPASTIRAWSRRDQWDARKGVAIAMSMDAETARAVEIASQPPQIDTPTDLAEKQTEYQKKFSDAAVRLARHVATLQGPELIQQADKLAKADAVARKALKLETEKPSTVIQIGILANKRTANEHQAKAITLQ